MMLIIGLVLTALILIFFEVILPGGILGIAAAACILAATWLGFADYGLLGGASVFILSISTALVLIFAEFKLMAKTSLGKGFFLSSSVSGHSNETVGEASVVGKEAKALTRLNPSGKVAIDGRAYDAHSQDGYIESGETVLVADRDNFKLIISKT